MDLKQVKTERRSYLSDEEKEYKITEDLRYSVGSIISDSSSENNRQTLYFEETNINCISILAKDSINYFSCYCYNDFLEFTKEVEFFDADVLTASERITRLVCKNFDIGLNPSKNSANYQPLVFSLYRSKLPFFYDFQCRAFALFSHTKRQMSASIPSDYSKIFNVLDKKIQLIIAKQAKGLKQLVHHFSNISYETVVNQWQVEYDNKINDHIKTNQCMKLVKDKLNGVNKKFLFENRIAYMQQKTIFPKFSEKKWIGEFTVQLSSNQKDLVYEEKGKDVVMYPIDEISHVIEGIVTPIARNKLVSKAEINLTFSVITTSNTYLNFKAPDLKTANMWTDGLFLLTKIGKLSTLYESELEELVHMDLMLRLIELQDVTIPKRAPPVPKLPEDIRPVIPPKPVTITYRKMQKVLPALYYQ